MLTSISVSGTAIMAIWGYMRFVRRSWNSSVCQKDSKGLAQTQQPDGP